MFAIRKENNTSHGFTMSCGLSNQLSCDKVQKADCPVRVGACQVAAAWVQNDLWRKILLSALENSTMLKPYQTVG